MSQTCKTFIKTQVIGELINGGFKGLVCSKAQKPPIETRPQSNGSTIYYCPSYHLRDIKWMELGYGCVRKIRLIQPMIITLKGRWIGWWSFSSKLNYVNARDNYM